MELCTHEECTGVRTIAGKLFDGEPLIRVDASEDTEGAEPYGSRCSLAPRAYFQVQDTDGSDEWYLVTLFKIKDQHTKLRLEVLLAQIDAENAAPVAREA